MNFEESKKVDQILVKYNYSAINLISILQDIQAEYKFLSREVMEYLSVEMDLSPAKIYSVATFYENFSLEPKGKYVFRVCDGTACHVRKSTFVLDALRKELGLVEGKATTDDMLYTIETVSCLGACGLAPVLTLNDVVYGEMTPDKIRSLVAEVKEMENGKIN